MILEYSERDVLSSILVEPAWYLVQIDGIKYLPSKGADSTNCWINGHIIKNDDTGDTKFAGVPTPFLWLINSKASFSAVGLFNSLGQEVKAGSRSDTDSLPGKRTVMFIGNAPNPNTGQMQNSNPSMFRQPKPGDEVAA